MNGNFILLITTMAASLSAAPFENLDFEKANTNSLTPLELRFSPGAGFGTSTDLLPGWQLFKGNREITLMSFNGSFWFGPTLQSIVDRNYNEGTPAFEGRYSLLLTRGYGFEGDEFYHLTQRGDIPFDAQFLSFTYVGRPFQVTINGEDISPHDSWPAFRPTTILTDISRMAGQNVELAFRTNPERWAGVLGSGDVSQLDAIVFVVPEPSPAVLMVIGFSVMACRWVWRRRNR